MLIAVGSNLMEPQKPDAKEPDQDTANSLRHAIASDVGRQDHHRGKGRRGRLYDHLRGLLDGLLLQLSAAALFVNPDRTLPIEQLSSEVTTAYERSEKRPDGLDMLIENKSIPAQESNGSGTSKDRADDQFLADDDPHGTAPKYSRDEVITALMSMSVMRRSFRKFLKEARPVVFLEGEYWGISLSTQSPYTASLKVVKPGNKALDSIVGKNSSRKQRERAKREGAITSVTSEQIEIARIARDIESDKAKALSEGRYVDLNDPVAEPTSELSPGDLHALGTTLQALYQSLLPPANAVHIRNRFLGRLQNIVDWNYGEFVNLRAQLFGSSVNNLGFASSDVDVTLELPASHDFDPKQLKEWTSMYRLARVLRRNGMQQVVPVQGARVPICKFYDPKSELHCDINFGNVLGVHNSRLLKTYTEIDPRVKPLIMLVKLWAKNRDVNDSADGATISSYAYSLMILNYLQLRGIIPSLQLLFDGPQNIMMVPRQQSMPRRKPEKGRPWRAKLQTNKVTITEEQSVNELQSHMETLSIETPAVDCVEDSGLQDEQLNELQDEQLVETECVEDQLEDGGTGMEEDEQIIGTMNQNMLMANVAFLDDVTHPSLKPYVSRFASLTSADIWCGKDGVASLFYGFLRFYGWEFRYRPDRIVSVRLGKVLDTVTPDLEHWMKKPGLKLIVEDPFQLDRNCTGVVMDPGKVVTEMQRAVKCLHQIEDSQQNVRTVIAEVFEQVPHLKEKKRNLAPNRVFGQFSDSERPVNVELMVQDLRSVLGDLRDRSPIFTESRPPVKPPVREQARPLHLSGNINDEDLGVPLSRKAWQQGKRVPKARPEGAGSGTKPFKTANRADSVRMKGSQEQMTKISSSPRPVLSPPTTSTPKAKPRTPVGNQPQSERPREKGNTRSTPIQANNEHLGGKRNKKGTQRHNDPMTVSQGHVNIVIEVKKSIEPPSSSHHPQAEQEIDSNQNLQLVPVRKAVNSGQALTTKRSSSGLKRCYLCGDVGHLKKNCPGKKKS
ncbi:uncharacterized protein SPPG_05340 [Spizellomyces punctatus DAOM BR117]|uniref:polynucleotide adenylyltransferase n=1 Tax=Spizellomyces punctatus (strain DAOM BR117) TaxID=645134 RepID=A0A0L0HES3_SPIPD|nr:uncharacterized protein SPPG_05340 [Spizellomyces punctatus DAOM BR117]KNC99965.1 hypothetical protein SPPG_05340 [Spizellomyces punctatus DAOM BR117]|eukprot:XP_016608005.1 hypothetical protein SPPG_05340 [Spizellomyces punctatus DAOM BR117]